MCKVSGVMCTAQSISKNQRKGGDDDDEDRGFLYGSDCICGGREKSVSWVTRLGRIRKKIVRGAASSMFDVQEVQSESPD